MSGDALVFCSAYDSSAAWGAALKRHLPDLDLRVWPDIGNAEEVRHALVWLPPSGFFAALPNLELIINLGAGADAILGHPELPDVPVVRIADPEMSRMMASYVVLSVLRYYRDFPEFERAQKAGHWRYIHPREPREVRVGVMGLGELGRVAASELARWGFEVRGWARTRKEIEGVTTFAGEDGLGDFLRDLEIVVVMLPLTSETRGLIDSAFLARMPRGVKLVNVARGEIIDEAALLAALESGRVAAATLDAFASEPLPADHPFWGMEEVLVTPHLASVAIPSTAAAQVADNIRRARAGLPLINEVGRVRGY